MKKKYWIGDIKNNTGPANVNKAYFKYLKNDIVFCKSNNKLYRVFHLLIHLPFINVVVVSGFSVLNYYLILLCKILGKKTFYLMHGYLKEELQYSCIAYSKKVKIEHRLMKTVYKIICVSKFFADFMKTNELDLSEKFIYVYNGFDYESEKEYGELNPKNFIIVSTGGGMRRKNNLAVCEAIALINNPAIKYIVIGKSFEDGDFIKQFPFVEYYEYLEHDEVLSKMKNSNLYIQNSFFDTFCLAVAEAVSCGCDILVTNNIGVKDVLENLDESNFIDNNNDIEEIKSKILCKMEVRQNVTYDCERCSWKNRSQELLDILNGVE